MSRTAEVDSLNPHRYCCLNEVPRLITFEDIVENFFRIPIEDDATEVKDDVHCLAMNRGVYVVTSGSACRGSPCSVGSYSRKTGSSFSVSHCRML